MSRPSACLLGFFGLILWVDLAPAQQNGDPFDSFRAPYSSATMPMRGRPGANGLPRTVVEPPGLGAIPGISLYSLNSQYYGLSSSSDFAPYYANLARERDMLQAAPTAGEIDPYRLYDSQYGRVYTPNALVDQPYLENLARREQLYFQAMNERDPKKRASLMRRYEAANRRASSVLSSRFSRNTSRGTPAGATTTRSGVAPTRPATAPAAPASRNATPSTTTPEARTGRAIQGGTSPADIDALIRRSRELDSQLGRDREVPPADPVDPTPVAPRPR